MVAGAVAALPGAGEVLAAGIVSSLHPANEAAAAGCVRDVDAARRQPQWRLLLDPQTGQRAPSAGRGWARAPAAAPLNCARRHSVARACYSATLSISWRSQNGAGTSVLLICVIM